MRPGTTVGSYQGHLVTVHYDHRARPYYVTVLNQATGVEERNRYYYGLEDELISWIRTPNASTSTTYDERQYVPIGAFAVGELERSWVAGSATRRSYYHAVEPMGLALGAFEFEHPGGPTVSFNPQTSVQRWSSFGMRMYQTGIGTPLPTRFPGQLELRGSDTRIWVGSNTVEYAHGLYLNRWSVYDPRVGQYLQPDPAAMDGRSPEAATLGYARQAPADFGDPSGEMVWCECLQRAIVSWADQWSCMLCTWSEPSTDAAPDLGAVGRRRSKRRPQQPQQCSVRKPSDEDTCELSYAVCEALCTPAVTRPGRYTICTSICFECLVDCERRGSWPDRTQCDDPLSGFRGERLR
jgi:RHS repeat-associated protein